MATDPQRLQEISDEQSRRERAWRDAPERAFGEVLKTAPAKGALVDAVDVDRPDADSGEPAPPAEGAPPTSAKAPGAARGIPDPRERQLRALLAARQAAPSSSKRSPSATSPAPLPLAPGRPIK